MGTNGLHITIPKEARNKSGVAPITVRAVFALPDKQKTVMDLEVPTGADPNYIKLLCDTYLRERTYGPGRNGFSCPAILQYLAKTRKPLRKPDTDPILWDLRVRWLIRKATLSLHHLESGKELNAELLPYWPTETSNVYKSLATRICGLPALYHADTRVCLKICDQLRQGRIPSDTYADPETLHWLLWAGQINGQPREKTFDTLRNSGIYDRPGKKVSNGSMDPTNLRTFIQKAWWENTAPNPIEKTIAEIEGTKLNSKRPLYEVENRQKSEANT